MYLFQIDFLKGLKTEENTIKHSGENDDSNSDGTQENIKINVLQR